MRDAAIGTARLGWSRAVLQAKRTVDGRRHRSVRTVDPADRLVREPVFLLSSVRSGSTLLRMLLDSHSEICAPHELHLGALRVTPGTRFAELALEQDNLHADDLENVLWDRLLHLALQRSGKRIIVDKTPANTLMWRRVATAWPHARYVFLTRHPVRVAESLTRARPELDEARHHATVTGYAKALAEAAAALDGVTVRYEELTADPQPVLRRICDYLGVAYEPDMLRYGDRDRALRRGLGDWGERIRSGRVQPAPPDPSPGEVPDALREACRRLGY